ncbi:MAG: ribosome biogenesis GTP-binding protein YihA/YsxC [Alphaproteobacteria bacterium]|nr:ribosome biogenesis GTP-binding protein YihA/YsxC [Alphaproteobacteria bacterium]
MVHHEAHGKAEGVSGDEEAAAIEAGRLLFAGPCEFLYSQTSLAALPPAELPEVAFAGRSNVGKSSLINALTGRRALARASSTPGRTQQLNFFRLASRLMLVDLPGYGYAKAPKADVARWTELVMDYLRGRPGLLRVCLLIDARHGIKENDIAAMKLLDRAAVVYQAVLTKIDKQKPAALVVLADETRRTLARHPAAHPDVILTSAETGAGMAELRAALAALALPG